MFSLESGSYPCDHSGIANNYDTQQTEAGLPLSALDLLQSVLLVEFWQIYSWACYLYLAVSLSSVSCACAEQHRE